MSDSLLTPPARLSHEIEMKKSRFLTLVARVFMPAETREVVNERKAAMPDARHHCAALVASAGDTQSVSHSSDDGGPPGMAGRPMLDVLAGSRPVDVIAVVTRYFGGTLLGTGSLMYVYSGSVRERLEGTPAVVRDRVPAWSAALPHADAGCYLSELAGIGASVGPEYEAGGVRAVVVHLDADTTASLFARLPSGSIRPEPEGTRTVEVSAGATRDGSAKR